MDGRLKIALILEAYDRMSAVVMKGINKVQSGLQSFSKKLNEIGNRSFDFAKKTAGIGLVAAGILAGPIKAAAEMERMNVALRTSFQGNAVAATKAFQTINSFAAQTPYELEEVMRGFIKLKNMGLDPSKDALTAYGNTAAAMGKSLNDMVEAVADAATGEFERLKEFGIRASSQGNKVTFTFQGVKTTVGKNSKEIESYLKKLGHTKFAGGIEAQSKTLYGQFSTLKDQVKMTGAEAGKTLIPVLNDLFQKIKPILDSVTTWIQKNPKLTQQILLAVGALAALSLSISAVSFLFGGLMKGISVISKIVSGILNMGKVILWVGRLFLMNPIPLVITAIALGIFLIIKHWDKIKAYFERLLKRVAGIFSSAWEWIKNMFLNYTPGGLIIKHWDKIKQYFVDLWNKVKQPFVDFWNWLTGLGSQLWEAGKNIIKSIWDGILSMINKPVEAVKNMVGKIRKFLPFSPAKEGPLRDIHRIRLVETIAEGIKPTAMVNAMQKVTSATRKGMFDRNTSSFPQLAYNGTGSTINATFNIHLSGSATKADANVITGEIKKQFQQLIKQYYNQRERTRFS